MANAPDHALVPHPSTEDGPRRAGRLRQWLLRLALGGSVLAWLVYRTEWAPLAQLFRDMELKGWLLALLLYAGVQMSLSSSRWRVLAAPLGFHAPWRHFFLLYYVGLFFNLFLPTSMGGDVVRAWSLAQTKERRVAAFLSVVSDRLSGLLALVLLACLATVLVREPLPPWIYLTVWSLTGGIGAGYLLLPLLARRSPKLLMLSHALSVSRGHRRGWLLALAISVAVQSASVVQIAWMGKALGLDVPLLGYAVVVPLVSLLTMLPLSVGGMGVREGSLMLLLAPLGVSNSQALALGLSWFAMNLVMGVVGGLVYLFRRPTPSHEAAELSSQPQPHRPVWLCLKGVTHGPFGRDSAQGRSSQRQAAV